MQGHGQISDPEPGSVAVRGAFVIDDEPSKAIEPGKGALDDPAFGDRHEATRHRWGPAGHLVLPAQATYLLGETALVGPVGKYGTQPAGPGRA